MDSLVAGEYDLPALGRPLHLGTLYDRRSDTIIPGITLWKPETLQEHVCKKPQPKTEFRILSSDDYDNVASALKLTSPLKASILGGKVDLDGPARYLKEIKKSRNQIRVIHHYFTATRVEKLTMYHLGPQNIDYPAVFDQGEATHVVAEVLYGAQAFFVFDREVDASEDKQEIQRELTDMVQKLPEKAQGGAGTANIQTKGKKNIENFRCTFYGDVCLQNNPVNDSDAVRIYSDLPKLLGKDGEKAVPVMVSLYPLEKLDSRAAQLVREISTDLVTRAQAAIEQLSACEVQCQDLVSRSEASFPVMTEKVQHFQSLCKRYKKSFQEQLAAILPSIRGGGQEEAVLENILIRKDQSPFNPKCLTEFLSHRTAEMDYVKDCCSSLKGVDCISSEPKRKQLLFDHNCKILVSLTFTSLQKEERYLQDLEEWMPKNSDPASSRSAYEKPKSKQWFEEEKLIGKTRECVSSFSEFASLCKQDGKTKFIISAVPDEDNPGLSIFVYEEGKLACRNFKPPLKPPPPPRMSEIGHDSVQLLFGPVVDSRTLISSYHVQYRSLGQENWTALATKAEEETFLVRELLPNTSYQFRYAVKSKVGLGNPSRESGVVKTLPTSPPGKPQCASAEPSALSVTWQSPRIIGEGVMIKEYKVRYKEKTAEGSQSGKREDWQYVTVGKKGPYCKVTGLRPETLYRFQVLAVCSDGAESSPSEETSISTLNPDEPFKDMLLLKGEGASLAGPKTPPVTQEDAFPALGCPLQHGTRCDRHSDTIDPGCAGRFLGKELEASTSLERLAQKYARESTLVEKGERLIFVLPLQKESEEDTAAKYHLGDENVQKPDKVIMLMGATGAGKTTLINRMINYILGVRWEDPFRFKLVHEVLSRSEAESQTLKVTSYMANHQEGFQIPYSLAIIDTPGYGSTDGIQHDRSITEQIRKFFTTPGGIDHIDAVCFVVQAPLARLTTDQKYVFDSVLSIFGKDIKDNIQLLTTFAGGQRPPVLEAIKKAEVPCAKDANGTPVHFKFNNSALFASNSDQGDEELDEIYWNRGTKNMKIFFDSLNKLETKSLTLTKKVLQEQKELKMVIEGLQPRIKAGLMKMEELRKTQQALDQHKEDMMANKNFQYEVETTQSVTECSNGLNNNCTACKVTCCLQCQCPSDIFLYWCNSINSSTRKCEKCPGRCSIDLHTLQKHKFVHQVVKEKKIYENLKEKYDCASAKVMSTGNLLHSLSQEYEQVKLELVDLIKRSSQSVRRLQEIALKPNPLSIPEYIDLLIISEEQEKMPRYQERIRSLKEVRKEAEIIQMIANKETLLPGELGLF